MMLVRNVTLFLVFYLRICVAINCHLNDKCSGIHSPDKCCYIPGPELEMHCPTEVNDIIIHATDEEILIDCPVGLRRFQIGMLPNCTIPNVNNNTMSSFRIRFCPLPDESFDEFITKLGRVKINYFEFYGSKARNALTAKHFKNLNHIDNLMFSNNKFTALGEQVFESMPSLKLLDLQSNNLHLKRYMFKSLKHLQSLDISDNNIASIPFGVFENLKELQILEIWRNGLVNLDQHSFKGLKNLQLLELSRNRINKIHKETFTHLKNLTFVSLSSNNLTLIDQDLFRNNKELKLVKINDNLNLHLPDFLFANLSLQMVDISNCGLNTVPSRIFYNTTSLEIVKLNRNNLDSLPDSLFSNLRNLRKIYLGNNKLKIVPNFYGLELLVLINLQNNAISEIHENAFVSLRNLNETILRKNRLKFIDDQIFRHNKNLTKIDFSYNYLKSCDFIANTKRSIKTINLSHNFISLMPKNTNLSEAAHLKRLDLSYNRITTVQLGKLQTTTPLAINLKSNVITTVDFNGFIPNLTTFGTIDMSNNSITCDCFAYGLYTFLNSKAQTIFKKVEDMTCSGPPRLKSIAIVKIPPDAFTCNLGQFVQYTSGCPTRCLCKWRPSDRTLIIDCAKSNYTKLPTIDTNNFSFLGFEIVVVNFEKNQLLRGPDRNLMGYDNVTTLFLSHNQITEITWIPPKLKVLHIHNNQIRKLDFEILDAFKSRLNNLTLNGNPWSCECDIFNLTTFLRQNNKLVSNNGIYCANTTKLVADQSFDELCFIFPTATFLVIVVILLLVTVFLVTVYQSYENECKVWLYSHKLFAWCISEDAVDKNKIYDVFISYSHHDESFVVNELVPVLENNNYKLCLHYRDWPPGELITTHITNSVLSSRRTLVVLSPNFLHSVWGRMEFRTAHSRAISDGRARVIVLIYGDPDLSNVDPELRSYVMTKTYIEWTDRFFWDKIKSALPHRSGNLAGTTNEHSALIETNKTSSF